MERRERTEDEIVKQVEHLNGPRLVIITGGEPLLQELRVLVGKLGTYGKRVHVETNGTIMPSYEVAHMVEHWIVSPKLGSSGMEQHMDFEVLKFFRDLRRTEFKFVIANFADFFATMKLIQQLKLDTCPVVMQPVNNDAQVGRNIVEFIKDHKTFNIRVLPQLHVLLYGKTRGV